MNFCSRLLYFIVVSLSFYFILLSFDKKNARYALGALFYFNSIIILYILYICFMYVRVSHYGVRINIRLREQV